MKINVYILCNKKYISLTNISLRLNLNILDNRSLNTNCLGQVVTAIIILYFAISQYAV